MPLPIAPIAMAAARYGAVAFIAYVATRRLQPSAVHQASEDALDRVPEGLSASRAHDRDQLNGAARFRRIIRLGSTGPGLDLDAVFLGRLKFKKV